MLKVMVLLIISNWIIVSSQEFRGEEGESHRGKQGKPGPKGSPGTTCLSGTGKLLTTSTTNVVTFDLPGTLLSQM